MPDRTDPLDEKVAKTIDDLVAGLVKQEGLNPRAARERIRAQLRQREAEDDSPVVSDEHFEELLQRFQRQRDACGSNPLLLRRTQ